MRGLREALEALAGARRAEAAALEALAQHLGAGAQPVPATSLLTFTEAARQLGCTPSHVSRLVARGALGAVRIGAAARGQRVAVEDLERFIGQRRARRKVAVAA